MKGTDVELVDLRRRLARLRQEARNNEFTWRRSQQREMALLEAEDLPALLKELTDGLRQSFALQACTLVLCDAQHRLRHLLEDTGTDTSRLAHVRFVDDLDEILPVPALRNGPWLGPYLRSEHAMLFDTATGLASVALIPLLRNAALVGSLAFGSGESGRFTAEHGTDFLRHLGIIAAFCLENATNRARLVKRGFTDSLTGWNNRRYLDTRLHEEIARCRREQGSLVCMLLDVDHFKTINDRYGHAAGDDVLREIARRMAGQIRGSDISARFGGEEFAILMPNTTLEDACTVAERIRETVASAPFTLAGLATPDGRRTQAVAVTISIGLAACQGKGKGEGRGAVVEATARQLVAAADRALYRAKAAGRNTVVAADTEIPDDID